MNNNIVLIGYMGAGKTTIGRIIAKKRNMKFTDTDDLISESEKCSINDIFSKHGEPYFRDLETRLLKEMIGKTENTIISCGGGMPILEINRAYLKKLGRVIYLKASDETVYERLKGDNTRPLLKGSETDALKRISDMINTRNPFYEDAADVIINVDEITAEEAADKIIFEEIK